MPVGAVHGTAQAGSSIQRWNMGAAGSTHQDLIFMHQ